MSPGPHHAGRLGGVLRQVARTGLLVGGLGLALYGGLAGVAGWPSIQFVLVLLLAAPLALLLAWQVLDGWRTGGIAVWRQLVRRDEEPSSYWFNMVWYGLCGAALAGLACWSGWRLALGLAGG